MSDKNGLCACQARSGGADDPAEGSFPTPTCKSTSAVGQVATSTGWGDSVLKTQSKGWGPGLSCCPAGPLPGSGAQAWPFLLRVGPAQTPNGVCTVSLCRKSSVGKA